MAMQQATAPARKAPEGSGSKTRLVRARTKAVTR